MSEHKWNFCWAWEMVIESGLTQIEMSREFQESQLES